VEDHVIAGQAQSSVWRLTLAAVTLTFALACGFNAMAQTGNRFPSVLPNATITSDETNATGETEAPAVDEGVPPAATITPPAHAHRHHHPTMATSSYSSAVEPTHAMLKLKNDAWAYSHPDTSSRTLERVHAGKFLDVTGSTHYYLQVKLKNGATGYVPISAVDLTRPSDKIMRLSTDAAVLSQPNRYGKRLAEVHQGHDVHVIGISMNYMKIRMKSGLEGYIPMTSAE
jgi:hypothetical protein